MPECTVCGNWFQVPTKESKFFNIESEVFCSLNCLLSYIKASQPFDFCTLPQIELATTDCFGIGEPSCYSLRLNTNFRSMFEVVVAETFVLLEKFRLRYEPFVITLNNQSGKEFHYLPDFYFPDHGIILEVKGGWRGGGMKRFRAAKALLNNRLILIPSFYRRWFNSRLKDVSE